MLREQIQICAHRLGDASAIVEPGAEPKDQTARSKDTAAERDPLVRFYAGDAPDSSGHLLREIHVWPDEELEHTQSCIQWLFPLTEESGYGPLAPILNEEAIRAFRGRPDLRGNLRTSFMRMLVFYGFTLVGVSPMRVVPAASFAERSKVWLTRWSDHHSRITQMLKSLKLLGLEEEARAFFWCLADIYRKELAIGEPRISPETFRSWRCAVMDS